MHFADEETEVCHLPKMTLIKIWTLVCNFKPVLFPWQHRSLPSRIKEREQSSHDRWVAIREVGPCQMPHRVLGFLHDNVSGFPSQRCTSVQDLEGPPGEQRKNPYSVSWWAAPSEVWGKADGSGYRPRRGGWARREVFLDVSLREFLRLALDHPPSPTQLPKHVDL